MTKMGMQGFGTAYQNPQMLAQQADQSKIYNSQKKTSVTQKPDGTLSQSSSESGGTPMYNPNAQLPQGYTGFQQPAGMGQAQNAWQNILNSGGGTGMLDAFNNSFVPGMQYTIKDAVNQAMQMGSNKGQLNSSPMQRTQGDIAARAWAGIAPQLAATNLGEYGNAMNRYMGAAQGMEGNAMGQFGLGQNWANNAMNMGNMYQNQQQGMLGPYQQEMARMYAENNPGFGLTAQGSNLQNMVGPVQYQPSFLSNLLGLGTSVATMGALGGKGSLNPGNWFSK